MPWRWRCQRRKLAAKAARRKVVVAERKKLEVLSSSTVGRIRVALKGPIVRCLMPSTLFEIGIGHVDIFCLGIKAIFYFEIGESELQSRLAGKFHAQRFIEVEPARARKLVRGAAAYAAGLGLPEAKDTSAIEAIFGDVEADDCSDTFTFGKDSKPFYVSGPNDTPARIRTITRALEESRGTDGWHYMAEVAPGL